VERMFNLFSRKKQTNTQTIWVKKGSGGDISGEYDLFVFNTPKTDDFRESIGNILSSKNFPILKDLQYLEAAEVEIRIKGRK
jgi:hypothetical protein